ncbi:MULTISPECIES: hypothetical protein [unclassified Paenibacillus]|uniref:Uncharacterized protein n=1 Tax=Paenibacillus provencensis TaxID=441151 RepID=A0ABW3Q756_9BACL|nr:MULTISPECIES: hypothetical protein [unclassified Paenibacillus]MCM3130154.1 hypothetical protein [Paenibacillus sp. MER 78]SDX70656.1 hypothetical protein SAMN05518848_11242 [Paenibacillus sp. PDC88]SFS88222.1 hypothetical protein SAMN04488601_10638 [Paenibacillus sp. 453mf]
MIEFIKTYYIEIAAVIVGLYLFLKVKRVLRKILGIILSLAVIARLITLYTI